MIESESPKVIKENCLRLLVRREHSQQELLDKLSVKGFDRAEVVKVVDDLAEQGWQSDQRFAESYARYRIKKGYGPIKISYELYQRGIDCFDLECALLDIADDWMELLEQIYHKKYADDKMLSNKEWLKRNRFLQQRGFSGEMINTLFKRLKLQTNY
ncbi:MAG: regulatory protein RecX [Methylococcales bacterium]|nr:regulatory protein RecX [Methylococcales bacterium]